MIAPPPAVRIWASQLDAHDFPPVCAVTGRPAETWHRFVFTTRWTDGNGTRRGVRRAAGYLPMKKSASTLIRFLDAAAGLLALSFLLNAGYFIIHRSYSNDPDLSAIGGTLGIIGVATFAIGITALIVRRSSVGPVADVMDSPPGSTDQIVELRHVHPAFVAAVQQQHAARLAQSQGSN